MSSKPIDPEAKFNLDALFETFCLCPKFVVWVDRAHLEDDNPDVVAVTIIYDGNIPLEDMAVRAKIINPLCESEAS